jgi:hypothetical protein
MDGTTRIATEAITTDITTAGTIICTGIGFFPFTVALGIIAIGKQSYSTVRSLPLLEIASVLVRVDHVASRIVNADHGVM